MITQLLRDLVTLLPMLDSDNSLQQSFGSPPLFHLLDVPL
jgi:hypothetical protein